MLKIKEPELDTTKRPFFPSNSNSVIEVILKEYNLKEREKKAIEKFINAQDSNERENIYRSLPGFQIAQLARGYGFGRVLLKDFPALLKEKLAISESEAEEITKFLKEELLVYIKPLKKKKKALSDKASLVGSESLAQEAKTLPKKKDTYLEPIE